MKADICYIGVTFVVFNVTLRGIMDTKTKITNSTISILCRNPSGSLEEIATDAGVSRMTVSRHFKGREELIERCKDICFDNFEEAIERAMAIEANSLERVKSLLASMIPLFENSLFLLRFFNLNEYDQNCRIEEHNEKVYQIFQQAKEDGHLTERFSNPWISNHLFFLAIAMGDSEMTGVVHGHESTSIAIDTFLYGCASKKHIQEQLS
jgi:AcrR family transcriptional regulator